MTIFVILTLLVLAAVSIALLYFGRPYWAWVEPFGLISEDMQRAVRAPKTVHTMALASPWSLTVPTSTLSFESSASAVAFIAWPPTPI